MSRKQKNYLYWIILGGVGAVVGLAVYVEGVYGPSDIFSIGNIANQSDPPIIVGVDGEKLPRCESGTRYESRTPEIPGVPCLCAEGTFAEYEYTGEKIVHDELTYFPRPFRCIPPIGEYDYYSITDLNSKALEEGKYNTSGFVVWKSECPPCPPGAACAMCPPPTVIVSETPSFRVAESGVEIIDQILVLSSFINKGHQNIEEGEEYEFTLELKNYESERRFDGIGIEDREISEVE